MSNNQGSFSCAMGCWGLAAFAGLLAAVLLMVLGDWSLIQAIFAGIVLAIILGALLSWIICKPLPAAGEAQASAAAKPDSSAASGTAAAGAAGAAAVAAGAAGAAAASKGSGVTASKELKGQEDLAARKGDWKYEGDAGAGKAAAKPAAKKTAAKSSASKAKTAKSTATKSTAAKSKTAKSTTAKSGTAKSSAAKSSTAKSSTAKASTAKASTGKAGTGKASAAKSTAAKSTTAKSTAAKKPAAKPVAKDGRPEALKGPRGGTADDLKMIKGVGPKLEKMLNGMGFYHFDQVAGWRKKEVEWVDENLEGFKGRVSRDEWVKQAKVLAKGGTTEFSKKVKKGGVY